MGTALTLSVIIIAGTAAFFIGATATCALIDLRTGQPGRRNFFATARRGRAAGSD